MCNPPRLRPGMKANPEVRETENETRAVRIWTYYRRQLGP